VSRGDDHPRVLLGPTVALGVELHRADRPKGAVAAPAARLDVGLTLPARAYAFTYVDTENRPNSLYSTDGVLFVASLSGLATIF
jgi:hypothetical protein